MHLAVLMLLSHVSNMQSLSPLSTSRIAAAHCRRALPPRIAAAA